jgi:hypothetical protein
MRRPIQCAAKDGLSMVPRIPINHRPGSQVSGRLWQNNDAMSRRLP